MKGNKKSVKDRKAITTQRVPPPCNVEIRTNAVPDVEVVVNGGLKFPAKYAELKQAIINSVEIEPEVLRELVSEPTVSRQTLTDQAKQMFSETDAVLNLALRLHQKLFGGKLRDAADYAPLCVQGWIGSTRAKLAEVHDILSEINELIEAE